MDKIRAILLGMTGFGNDAFNVLIQHPLINLVGVFTPPSLPGPFPHYPCEKLGEVATRNKIPLYEGRIFKNEETRQLISDLAVDLIVVSTFDQIIPQNIISIPHMGVINVHASLLPKYRGPTPTLWVLANGEKETGITVHFIEDERIDAGRIIAQGKMKILPSHTDGRLRQELAKLSEEVLIKALHLIQKKDKTKFLLQNEPDASYYPKYSNSKSK